MSKLGLGMGLQAAADALMQWAQMRFQQREKDKDRAIADKRAQSQDDYYRALAKHYEGQEQDRARRAALEQGKFVADRFGGQEVPAEAIESVDPSLRPILFKTETSIPTGPAPTNLPGMPDVMETAAEPTTRTTVRQPQTASERVAGINAAARIRAEQMRQDYLTRKLAQDRELAAIDDARAVQALNNQLKMAADRIQATYAGIDARLEQAMFDAEADAILEQWKAQYGRPSNPLIGLIMGAQGGGVSTPSGQPAAGAPPPPPPRLPAPPRRRGASSSSSIPQGDPNDPLGIGIRPPGR